MTPNALPSRVKIKSSAMLFTFLVIFTLLLSSCGGGSSNNTSSSTKHILKIATQSYDFAQASFNPYNGHPNAGIFLVYETLYFVNMKQYPAADGLGVWSFLKDVTAPDANTVVMTFQKAYPPVLVNIAGKVFIIPQHVFASAGDPTKYLTDKPVGTGPFTLTRYQPDLAVYDKNPNYWQADKVKVDEIRFPEYKDNATLQLALPKGDVDWAGYFTSTLQQDFVAKDPGHNHIFIAWSIS